MWEPPVFKARVQTQRIRVGGFLKTFRHKFNSQDFNPRLKVVRPIIIPTLTPRPHFVRMRKQSHTLDTEWVTCYCIWRVIKISNV